MGDMIGAGDIVSAVSNVLVAGLQYRQAADDRRATADERRETQAHEAELERLRTENLREEAQLNQRLAREEAAHQEAVRRSRVQEEIDRDHYPFHGLPGSFRADLELEYRDLSQKPVLALLMPDTRQDGTPWHGLRARVMGDLGSYERLNLLRVRLTDRHFAWPHARLYANDLKDLPALVVETSHDLYRLHVRIGGCHLSGDRGGSRIQASQQVYVLRFPTLSAWTPERMEVLNRTASARLAFPLPTPTDDQQLMEVNRELASRIVALCVVAAMDGFHLLRQPVYDEQFDRAAEATGLCDDDWPVDLGVPADIAADPAYHLLHIAERHLVRGASRTALDTVTEVIEVSRSAPLADKHRDKARELLGRLPDSGDTRALLARLDAPPRPEPAPPRLPADAPTVLRPTRPTPGTYSHDLHDEHGYDPSGDPLGTGGGTAS
ncbi:hypothetical protein GCM10010245_48620 [Streptomyces spectabilis]|uniref:Uncharacterized protein n=1 Tax=Streptomyces spectabilis TaxID=68270 RepID=A0A5P2XK85_STRST|nr:hypothetical protein CP982_39660 [Streptomyces spectabilis]GGV29898.1 hypothetical protein GCM10010245_48620 [Streptomyces spectabilis]